MNEQKNAEARLAELNTARNEQWAIIGQAKERLGQIEHRIDEVRRSMENWQEAQQAGTSENGD